MSPTICSGVPQLLRYKKTRRSSIQTADLLFLQLIQLGFDLQVWPMHLRLLLVLLWISRGTIHLSIHPSIHSYIYPFIENFCFKQCESQRRSQTRLSRPKNVYVGGLLGVYLGCDFVLGSEVRSKIVKKTWNRMVSQWINIVFLLIYQPISLPFPQPASSTKSVSLSNCFASQLKQGNDRVLHVVFSARTYQQMFKHSPSLTMQGCLLGRLPGLLRLFLQCFQMKNRGSLVVHLTVLLIFFINFVVLILRSKKNLPRFNTLEWIDCEPSLCLALMATAENGIRSKNEAMSELSCCCLSCGVVHRSVKNIHGWVWWFVLLNDVSIGACQAYKTEYLEQYRTGTQSSSREASKTNIHLLEYLQIRKMFCAHKFEL